MRTKTSRPEPGTFLVLRQAIRIPPYVPLLFSRPLIIHIKLLPVLCFTITTMDALLHPAATQCAVLRTSITDSVDVSTGSVDMERFLAHALDVERHRKWVTTTVLDLVRDDELETEEASGRPRPPGKVKRRAPRRVFGRKSSEDAPLEVIPPEQSSWYVMYVSNFFLGEDDRSLKKFRQRFRLPYESYLDLLDAIKRHPLFDRWCAKKANNKKSSPIELLILGALRYLGRGWTFDDIEESTAISRDVHRVFFHHFVEFGSTVLYEKYVIAPVHLDEARSNMKEFEEAGFPGCIGSTDCTHIVTEGCEFFLKNNHLGPKSSHTTRTFNLTCNHRRRILHTTNGGPGRWNDQTMVRLDNFIMGIRDATILEDVTFDLFSHDNEGNIIKTTHKGVYVICDNGYLEWSCTVPPMTSTNLIPEIRWSKWVESMRKDVECTFGIMKGRFRILKSGIRTAS